MNLDEILKSLFSRKSEEDISRLIIGFNRIKVHNKNDLINLSRDEIGSLKLTGPEERKLIDYIKREFPKPFYNIKLDEREFLEELTRKKEDEIAKLKRQQEVLRREGEEKKKKLEKLRAENKTKFKEAKTNRQKRKSDDDSDNDDDGNDDDDDGESYFRYGYYKKYKSEYELIKLAIKENQKLISLKESMYVEDKKRCWIPYNNKFDENASESENTTQIDNKRNREIKNQESLYRLLIFVILQIGVSWASIELIFYCYGRSTIPHQTILKIVITGIVPLQFIWNSLKMRKISQNSDRLNDEEEESIGPHPFLTGSHWANLLTGKNAKIIQNLDLNFFKPVVTYACLGTAFYFLANRKQWSSESCIALGTFGILYHVCKIQFAFLCSAKSVAVKDENQKDCDSETRRMVRRMDAPSTFEYYKSVIPITVLWGIFEIISKRTENAYPGLNVVRTGSLIFIGGKIVGRVLNYAIYKWNQ